jgi:hypothetical protein
METSFIAYDPRSKTFGFTYAAPEAAEVTKTFLLFYGYSSIKLIL